MSENLERQSALLEDYGRETVKWRLKSDAKVRDFAAGREILASPPDVRAWFLLEAWRLNGQTWRGGTHPHTSGTAWRGLGLELLKTPLFCTPDQMQRLIWQADCDEFSPALLRNIARHLQHWGMTPDVQKMLKIKRVELARIAGNKRDRARLEQIDAWLGTREKL